MSTPFGPKIHSALKTAERDDIRMSKRSNFRPRNVSISIDPARSPITSLQPDVVASHRKVRSLDLFLHEVDQRLITDGTNPHGNHNDPLDELVYIILSAQTESYLYSRTYEELKSVYTPWDRLLTASEDRISEVIRQGGLAQKKARQLKSAMNKIVKDQGHLSLEFLRERSDHEVFEYLTSVPGIGTKSAKCVMMYSLGRAVFPVDTHVWRISRRLGIAPSIPKPSEAQMEALEKQIPKDLRYRLHVNFLSLGKQTCRTYYPRCGECSLSAICPSSGRPDDVWSSWRRPMGVWANAKPVT